VDRLKTTLFELVFPDTEERSAQDLLAKFPVAMPSTLSRRDLGLIRRKTYWVAEKSDGDRLLLLSLATGAYLIDSKLQFFKIDRSRFYLPRRHDISASQDKTLLDCLLVWNHTYQRFALMVIDIYAVEGQDVASQFFRSRIEAIRERVVVSIRAKYSTDVASVKANPDIPFVVQGKEYWTLDQMPTIFERINYHFDNNAHRFIYCFERRHNENDGIIFVPDERPLRPGLRDELKKWKWPEMTTITFSMTVDVETRDDGRPPRTTFQASLGGGPNGVLLPYREIYFRKPDGDRLLKDAAGYHGVVSGSSDPCPFPYTLLVECFYDSKSGEWSYYRLRFDVQPTPYPQAMIQLEATAERLTKDELLSGLNIKAKSRPSSNPVTPLTPATPSITSVYPNEKHSQANDDTSSPSPVNNAQTSGSNKRAVEEIYRGSSHVPANESKRARVDPNASR